MKRYLLLLMFVANAVGLRSQGFVWAKNLGGQDNDFGRSVTTDASGNIYTTGVFSYTVDFDPGPGVYNLVSAGAYDVFVTKFDANGNFIWARAMGGPAMEYGNGIAVDAAGNVYTVGSFEGTADFDPSVANFLLFSASLPGWGGDAFISKLDAAGNFVWAKQVGGTGEDALNAITRDNMGNMYFTGFFQGTVDFDPALPTFTLTADGNWSAFVLKLNTAGNFIWASQLNAVSNGFGDMAKAAALVTDVAGNVYLTGNYQGTVDFDPGPNIDTLSSVLMPPFNTSSVDVFISKLDAFGNFVWAKTLGSNTIDYGRSISLDALNGLFLTGSFYQTIDFDPGPGTYTIASNGNDDAFVLKLDINGNFAWAHGLGSVNTDAGISVATDIAGNSYITGSGTGPVDFDPGPGTYTIAGLSGLFIEKLDYSGNFVWAKTVSGTQYATPWHLHIDALENIFITGLFKGTLDFDPGPGVANLTAGGGYFDYFILKLGCPAVNPAGAITGLQGMCAGDTLTYGISPVMGANGYSWTVPLGASIIAGAGTPSITVKFGALGGTVTVIPLTVCGSNPSASLAVTVNPLPVFMAQPVNQTIMAGAGVQFVATGSGASLLYQWQENSGPGFVSLSNSGNYSGVTTPSLNIANALLSQNNYSYRCLITAAGCPAISDTAWLAVITPSTSSGIQSLQGNSNFRIYPNPAHDKTMIYGSPALWGAGYSFCDQTGRVVLYGKLEETETTVALEKLAAGLYFLQVENGRPVKIIKE